MKSIISMKVRKKKYSDLSEGLKKVETYRREWQKRREGKSKEEIS